MTDKRFNPDRAHVLASSDRKKRLPPEEVIDHLDIRSSDIIADLGAGTGFFTIPIAKQAQRIQAVDIEPRMLEMLKQKNLKILRMLKAI